MQLVRITLLALVACSTPSDTAPASHTGNPADTGADSGRDSGADSGKDSGTDSGADSGTDTGKDTGTDTGTDTGKDTSTDTDSGTDSGKDDECDDGTTCVVYACYCGECTPADIQCVTQAWADANPCALMCPVTDCPELSTTTCECDPTSGACVKK